MNSGLKDIVISVAKARGISLPGGQVDRIRNIERQLDEGDTSLKDAVDMVRKEFGYHLERDDYLEIMKKIKQRHPLLAAKGRKGLPV